MTDEISQEELKERLEHRDAINNIKAVLSTGAGRAFMKYLFSSFDVGELPTPGLNGNFLNEELGRLRAGNSLFKIVAIADPAQAAGILAELEKEKYEEKLLSIIGRD